MRCFLCLCLLILGVSSFAQKQRSFTFDYATNVYQGDFSSTQAYRNSFVLGINLNGNKFLTGEFQARFGAISAQSLTTSSPIVNYVRTNYFSLNYGLKFRLINIKERFDLNFVQGFGIIRYNPKTENGDELLSLSSTRKKGESFSNVALILPSKISMNYYSNYGISYGLNTGFLNTRTDYLDNLSELADKQNKDNVFYIGVELMLPLKKRKAQVE